MALVRLDKVRATAHLVSFTFATDLKNGAVVALGDLATDGESYVGGVIADVAKDRIVFHYSEPLMYDEAKKESEFVLTAGTKGRGYILEAGDVVTVTDDLLSGTTVKGEFVIPEATKTELKASATVANEVLMFKVIAKEKLGGEDASVLEVVKTPVPVVA